MCDTCDVTRSFDARRASVSAFVCVVPAKGKWTKDQWSKMKSKKRPRENTPVLDAQTEAVDREQFLKAFESKFYFVIYWFELNVRLMDVGCFHFETWLFYIKAQDKLSYNILQSDHKPQLHWSLLVHCIVYFMSLNGRPTCSLSTIWKK